MYLQVTISTSPCKRGFFDHHYANLVGFLELKLIKVWVCPKTGPSGVAISNLSTPSLQKFVNYSVSFAPLVLFCSWICFCFSKMWFSVTGYLSFQFRGGGQKFIMRPQFSNEYKKMCWHLVSSALLVGRKEVMKSRSLTIQIRNQKSMQVLLGNNYTLQNDWEQLIIMKEEMRNLSRKMKPLKKKIPRGNFGSKKYNIRNENFTR